MAVETLSHPARGQIADHHDCGSQEEPPIPNHGQVYKDQRVPEDWEVTFRVNPTEPTIKIEGHRPVELQSRSGVP